MLQNTLLVFVTPLTVTLVTADSQFFETQWKKCLCLSTLLTAGGKRVFAQMVTQDVDKSPLRKTGIFTIQSCYYAYVFKRFGLRGLSEISAVRLGYVTDNALIEKAW